MAYRVMAIGKILKVTIAENKTFGINLYAGIVYPLIVHFDLILESKATRYWYQSMLTKTQAIQNFLTAKSPSDLASLYSNEMECQVLVSGDKGERVSGEYNGHKWQGWSDGQQTWKNFRIPLHANGIPEFTDTPMKFDLEAHADGIGMTGWNWVKKQSIYVAFDFDAITGHSERHEQKLTDTQLKEVQETACKIPWVTVRRSTSGNGLHLYVFLIPVSTENHTEHMALARAILSKMSAVAGFDFDAKVDNVGSNIWIWHRKYVRSNGIGLKLVKQGELLSDIPINWRDHIKVASGQRKKNKPGFIPEASSTSFEEFCGQHTKVQLDDEHRALMEFLNKNNCLWWWDQDASMLVAHTADLKKAHAVLSMRGIFETISEGRETGADQNCYGFALRRGGWVIRRHTPGVQEHESWDQDSSGWTRCYLNRDPDIRTASRFKGGNEMETGGFFFKEMKSAVDAAKALGAVTSIPERLNGIPSILKPHKDGRLVLQIEAPSQPSPQASDFDRQEYGKLVADMTQRGWVLEKTKWKLVFGTKSSQTEDKEIGNYDDLVRHLVSESGENSGWVAKSDGSWVQEPLEHIRVVLTAAGVDPKDNALVVGQSVLKKWTLTNKPFAPEYPGDRIWNRGAAQLAFVPSSDIDNLKYDTWTKILNHSGSGLDISIKMNKWCKENNILTGGDYLKLWAASMFQNPLQPLPYLFFYGPQGSGKTIFHESLSMLMTKGYAKAGDALINPQGFNGELASAVLCAVDELDLRANKSVANNRIKDWVTAKMLSIHPKGKTPFLLANSSHWVQTSNNIEYCPIFPNDTRITMCYVQHHNESVSRDELLEKLRKEAPDFLAHVLKYEIPASNGRLHIPIIETDEKRQVQEESQSDLERYITEHCFYIPGKYIKVCDFYDRFIEWLEPSRVKDWSKIKMNRALPPNMPKGRLAKFQGQFFIGNVSWEKPTDEEMKMARFVVNDQNLIIEGE